MTYRASEHILPIPDNIGARSRRAYKNNAEGEFAETARRNGWSMSKRGWPDFVCVKDGELIAVEVKPTAKGQPKLEQLIILQWLADHGIKAFVWNPETGFRRIKPSKPPP